MLNLLDCATRLYLHCPSYNCKFFWIIHSFTWDAVPLCQIIVIWGIHQVKQLSVFGWHSSKHTVEYVIISFIRHLNKAKHMYDNIKMMYCGCHKNQFSKSYKILVTVVSSGLFLKQVMVKIPFKENMWHCLWSSCAHYVPCISPVLWLFHSWNNYFLTQAKILHSGKDLYFDHFKCSLI